MKNVAAHGAGKQAQRENFGVRRGGPNECAFPPQPPHRCYCAPAAFHSVDGATHHRLLVAYGASRPCSEQV